MDPATIIPPAELKELESALAHFVTARYGTIAAAAFYFYDFVLTFGDEVELIWDSRWTVVKAFFFITRYMALGYIIVFNYLNIVHLTSISLCFALGMFSIIGIILLGSIEVILQMRLFALYNYDKRVVIPVITLFAMLVCAQLGMAGYEAYYFISTVSGPDKAITEEFGICAGGSPPWFYVFWITFMIFDFIVFALAAFKSFLHYRQIPDKNWRGASVMRILMRDSFIYFMINFIVFFVASIIYTTGNAYLYDVIGSWQIVIPAVLVGRLVVNVRRFYQQSEFYVAGTSLSFHHPS